MATKSIGRELNDRQLSFCAEYLVDLNGTQGAIRAGYSAHRADVAATRLLQDERIKAEIARRMQERNDAVELDARWVLEKLKAIVDRDPDGSKNVVAIKDLLRTLELIGKHTDVGAFQDKVQVDAGEDMVELILAARKRHRAMMAKRAGGNGQHDEMGRPELDPC